MKIKLGIMLLWMNLLSGCAEVSLNKDRTCDIVTTQYDGKSRYCDTREEFWVNQRR